MLKVVQTEGGSWRVIDAATGKIMSCVSQRREQAEAEMRALRAAFAAVQYGA